MVRFKRRLHGLAAGYANGELGLCQVTASVQSWVAHAGHADSYGLRKKVFGQTVLTRKEQAA